jgi:DNA-binding transcriptional LysR family regulator
VAYAACSVKSVEVASVRHSANSLATKAFFASIRSTVSLPSWCPAYPGFFLYYPSRRQLPAALRAFVDFARSGGGAVD